METDGLTTNVPVITEDDTSNSDTLSTRFCSWGSQAIKRRLPILNWVTKYEKNFIIGDIIAGFTVGITAVPQVMAYALLAGLSPQYGLYSSFVAPFVYIFLGSCRQVTMGPTAIIALISLETCGPNFPECVALASFYSGVFELVLSLLSLGSIVSLISEPVTIGFTAGAAFTISSSQLKSFLGMGYLKGSGFIGYWREILSNLTSISGPDTALGCFSVIFLILCQKLGQILKPTDQTQCGRITKKLIWLLSVARNALVVFTTSTIAYLWGNPPFALTGEVLGGFPPFEPPHFLLPNKNNHTKSHEEYLTFGETWSVLRTGPIVIAFVAILQNVAISKIYGSGQRVDGNQEMLALGVSKILGSFFSAAPVSGSFSRSAVNEASGVRSQLGGLFTGCLILLSLGFLTSAFYYIPKASLAAVIICAVISLIEFETILPMWRISKIDSLICCTTFLSALVLGMEYGIGVGVVLSVLALLYESIGAVLSPELKTDEESGVKLIILRPKQGLRFPGVDAIRKYVNKYTLQYSTAQVIGLDCLHWTTLDYSAASALASLIKSLKRNGKYLILFNTCETWVNALKAAGVSDAELHCCWDTGEDELITQFVRKSFPQEFV